MVTAPLRDQKATTVVQAMQQHWYPLIGCPKKITTDRGTNFLSNEFKAQARLFWGARCYPAKAYNQSENGLVERVHRTLKGTILKRSEDGSYGNPRVRDWARQLPHAVLALNLASKKHLGGV